MTRKQYEDWRAAKNVALRGFLQQNSRDTYLITITAPGYVHATFMNIRLLTTRLALVWQGLALAQMEKLNHIHIVVVQVYASFEPAERVLPVFARQCGIAY